MILELGICFFFIFQWLYYFSGIIFYRQIAIATKNATNLRAAASKTEPTTKPASVGERSAAALEESTRKILEKTLGKHSKNSHSPKTKLVLSGRTCCSLPEFCLCIVYVFMWPFYSTLGSLLIHLVNSLSGCHV